MYHLCGVTELGSPWSGWVERWERQQERYLIHRAERFALMLDYAEAHVTGDAPRVLDLCCGNGALTRRVLERFPGAQVTAADWDPVHLAIAAATLPADVEIREVDVASPGWRQGLLPGSLDLVVSATALHWLEDDALVRLYDDLAELLALGGAFLNADHFPSAEPTIRSLSAQLTEDWQEDNFADGQETHSDFHLAAASDPLLAEAAREREARFGEHRSANGRDVSFHHAALRNAGFREVAEVWRHREDAVLFAIR
jgi:trans-aconitate methyltransferase